MPKLNPFGRGPGDGPTADDIERAYAARIERLLGEFEPRGRMAAAFDHKRDFRDLANWARETWAAKSRAEKDIGMLTRELNLANTEIGRLNSLLDGTQASLHEKTAALERCNQELNNIHADYAHQMQVAESGHQNELAEVRKDLDRRINALTDDMMIAQADSRAWTDEKLKKKFSDVKMLVDQITSPHSIGAIQDSAFIRAEIDPDGFLDREGPASSHFVLKQAVWNVVFEHFFASSFGFGALGPGAGRSALVGLYTSWRGLFGHRDDYGSSIPEVFSQGWEANNWRSITFESLMAAVLSTDGWDSHSLLHDRYESNIVACGDKIASLLNQATGMSLDEESMTRIDKLSRSAADLGLQFGVQPSHMQLIRPSHRDTVEIGKKFVDCIDGLIFKGKGVQVDIYVSPGLTRVGDGKKDFSSEVLLVPCNVYPLST